MVARVCSVCAHQDREALDAALADGAAVPALAARFGLSASALYRHRARHPAGQTAPLVLAADRRESLPEQVRRLHERTLAVLDQAEAAGRPDMVLRAVREARQNVVLLAKLLSSLDDRPAGNVLLSPEWLQLRGLIIGTLAAFPEARLAVIEGLQALEGGHGAGG